MTAVSTMARGAGATLTALMTLVLAACDHNGDGGGMEPPPPPPPMSQTINDVVSVQINTLTCEQATPQDVSELTLDDTDDEIDVTTLTPACASGS